MFVLCCSCSSYMYRRLLRLKSHAFLPHHTPHGVAFKWREASRRLICSIPHHETQHHITSQQSLYFHFPIGVCQSVFAHVSVFAHASVFAYRHLCTSTIHTKYTRLTFFSLQYVPKKTTDEAEGREQRRATRRWPPATTAALRTGTTTLLLGFCRPKPEREQEQCRLELLSLMLYVNTLYSIRTRYNTRGLHQYCATILAVNTIPVCNLLLM